MCVQHNAKGNAQELHIVQTCVCVCVCARVCQTQCQEEQAGGRVREVYDVAGGMFMFVQISEHLNY